MAKVDWLDRLTFREIEMINEKQKRDSNFMFLMIEFPKIHFEGTDFSVVYFEQVSQTINHITVTTLFFLGATALPETFSVALFNVL